MRAGGVNFDSVTGQPLLQNFGQAASPFPNANTAAQSSTTPSTPASTQGTSGMQAGQMGSAICGAVTGVAQIIGNVCSYIYGQRIQDAQFDMQMSHLKYQGDSAALTRDAQLATAETQMESIRIQEEGQALNNKALERRKKCEDAVVVEKAKKQQHQLTKKATKGRFSKAAIRRIFNDPRAVPSYGKPASPVRAHN